MRSIRRLATAVALGAVALGGCGAAQSAASKVEVHGEPGAPPDLVYQRPLLVQDSEVSVIWEGAGPELAEGEPILIDFYAEDASDGSLINETYSADPHPYLLSPESLGVEIYQALNGRTVGSRILQLIPPGEREDTATVAVFDILPTRASGEAVEPREGLPTVRLSRNGVPTITIPEQDPPTDLVVQPLIHGEGQQVAPGQVLTVQYVGVKWSDGEVFESTWTAGKLPVQGLPIGVGSVIDGWDVGLVEQPVGSQVLLIVPPHLHWGGSRHELAEETLVFVVDILAARGREDA